MGKTPKKIAYDFILYCFLDLLGTFLLFQLLAVRVKAFDIIFFAIFNQKTIYN